MDKIELSILGAFGVIGGFGFLFFECFGMDVVGLFLGFTGFIFFVSLLIRILQNLWERKRKNESKTND